MFLLKGPNLMVLHGLADLVLLLHLLGHPVVKLLLLVIEFVEVNLFMIIKKVPSSVQISYFALLGSVSPLILWPGTYTPQ
jgi:hypothetical protein